MVKISNKEELEAWLEDQPVGVQCYVAVRVSMRSVTLLAQLAGHQNFEREITDWMRCCATLYVGAKAYDESVGQLADHAYAAAHDWVSEQRYVPTERLEAGLNSMANAIDSAFAKPDQRHIYVAKAADYAGGALGATNSWELLAEDIEALQTEPILRSVNRPLFRTGENGNPIDQLSDHLRAGPMDFWSRWLSSFSNGRGIPDGVLEEIIRRPDEDWRKGAAHMAGIIAGIEARYLVEKTPHSEVISVSAETGRLRAEPVMAVRRDLFQTALDKVRDALEDLRPDGGLGQQHTALAPIAKRLDRTLSRYAGNPQRVHDDFLLSAKQVNHLLETHECAPGEEVDALRTYLITGADDIRAADDVVRASVEARMNLGIDKMRVEDTHLIAHELRQLAENSEGELADSLVEDAEVFEQIDLAEWQTRDRSVFTDAVYRAMARTPRASKAIDDFIKIGDQVADGYDRGKKLAQALTGIWRLVRYFLELLGG